MDSTRAYWVDTTAGTVRAEADLPPDFVITITCPGPDFTVGEQFGADTPWVEWGRSVAIMRMLQRNDGLGPYDGHSRLSTEGQSSSSQQTSNRLGEGDTYR